MKFAELNEKELMDVEGGVMPHVDKDGTIRTCTGVPIGHIPFGPFIPTCPGPTFPIPRD